MKQQLHQQARVLRGQGFSLAEISTKLSVSKSTASLWVRGVVLSSSAANRLVLRAATGRKKASEALRQKSLSLINHFSITATQGLRSLPKSVFLCKLLCALLYWCEGEKITSALVFTNSDPLLVKAYLRLLRAGFKIDKSKLRVCLHLHSYHNQEKQKIFWSKVTGIPLRQFSKVYKKKNSGRSKKVGYQGCASVRYYDHVVAKEVFSLWKQFGAIGA